MPASDRTVVFLYDKTRSARLVGSGPLNGKYWRLSAGTFSIGRDATCDLSLPKEPGISKLHCKIALEGNVYLLIDEDSRNGTLVNGTQTRHTVLKHGDEIQICTLVFRFEHDPNAPEPASPPSGEATEPFQEAPAMARSGSHKPAVNRSGAHKPAPAPEPSASQTRAAPVWPYVVTGAGLSTVLVVGLVWVMRPDAPSPSADPQPAEVSAVLPNPAEEPVARQDAPVAQGSDSAAAPAPEKPAPKEHPRKPERERQADPAAGPRPNPKMEFTGNLVTTGRSHSRVLHDRDARIREVMAKAGQKVMRGDSLIAYEDPERLRRLEEARARYERFKSAANKGEFGEYSPVVSEAKAEMDRLESAPPAFLLRAPCDGVVKDVMALAGQRVVKGALAARVGCGDGRRVEDVVLHALLPVSSAGGVLRGDGIIATVDGVDMDGEVESVSRTGGAVKVIIELAKSPARSKDGMVVKFRFTGDG